MDCTEKIRIYSPGGILRHEAAVGEGSRRVCRLGEENHVEVRFSAAAPVAFRIADFADIGGERFFIADTPQPSLNADTGGYDYRLRMEAEEGLWRNRILKLRSASLPEVSFRLTASPEGHLAVIIRALAAEGLSHRTPDGANAPFTASADESLTTEARLIDYNALSIYDALALIAETFGCEWWRQGADIRLGYCERGEIIPVERGLNVSSIKPSGSASGAPNRLYAFGGSANIPPYYRKRLILTVTGSDSGRFFTEPASLSFGMFNPALIRREEGRSDWLPVAAGKTLNSGRPADYDDRVFLFEHTSAELLPGSYRLRLSRMKPNVTFQTTTGTPKRAVPLDASLRFDCRLSWTSANGTRQSADVPYSALTAFSLNEGANPTWRDFAFSLDAKAQVSVSLTIRFIPRSADAHSLRVLTAFPSSGEMDPPEGADEYSEEFARWAAANGWISVDDADSPCFGPLPMLSLPDGEPFTAEFNPSHEEQRDALPFRLLSGAMPQTGARVAFASDADALQRVKVPGCFFSPQQDDGLAEAITSDRLRLPEGTPFLDAHSGITALTAVEHVEFFEDIYPRQRFRVAAPFCDTRTQREDDGGATDFHVWYLCIESLNAAGEGEPFSFNSDFQITETLSLRFTSGLLNGMEFQTGWHPDGTDATGGRPCLEVILNSDYGPTLPNLVTRPKEGDTFTLLGWADDRVFDLLVADAEEELKEKALEWVERSLTDGQTFDCAWLPEEARDNGLPILGQRVCLKAPDLFPRGEFVTRVLGWEYPLDIPFDNPAVTAGDRIPAKRLAGIERRLEQAVSLPKSTQTQRGKGLGGSVIVADLSNQADAVAFNDLGELTGGLPSTVVRVWADGRERTDARVAVESDHPGVGLRVDGQRLSVTSADLSMPALLEIALRVTLPGVLDLNLQEFSRRLTFTLRRQRGEGRLQLMVSPSALHRAPDGSLSPLPVSASVCLFTGSSARVLGPGDIAKAGLFVLWTSSDQEGQSPAIPAVNPPVGDDPGTQWLQATLCRPSSDPDDPELLDIETIPVVNDGKEGEQGQQGEPGTPGKDGENPYVVQAFTLTGDKIKNGRGSTRLYARVLRSGAVVEDSSSSPQKYLYSWEKFDADGNPVNWKSTGTALRTGNPLTVTASEIDLRATFRCTVTLK